MALIHGAACGGGDGLALTIETTQAGLLADLDQVRIAVHSPERDCGIIRTSGPETKAVLIEEFDRGEVMQVDELLPGRYVIAVWGLADRVPQAFGCTAGVRIENKARTRVSVVMAPY